MSQPRETTDGAAHHPRAFCPSDAIGADTSANGNARRRQLDEPEHKPLAILDESDVTPEEQVRDRQTRQAARTVNRSPCTDAANGERLVCQLGGDLRYCYPFGCWLIWDRIRWKRDESAAITQFAKLTAVTIYQEAALRSVEDTRAADALAAWAKQSQNRPRLEAMSWAAQSEPGIPVLPAELDRDPWLLNCQNGTINLRTGVLQAHRREDLISRLSPVEYDPQATHPLWEDLLNRVLPDPGVRGYVQRAAGYCLVGLHREDVLFVLQSVGGGGKSTLLRCLATAMGDYATAADSDAFLDVSRTGCGHSESIASLAGRRLVMLADAEKGRRLATAKLKHLTGGDILRASHKGEKSFEFEPVCTPWLAVNDLPSAPADDTGLWRRLRRIPWTPIPRSDADPKARDRLLAEALPAVLGWMVTGCLAWQHDGLGEVPAVTVATEQYRASEDVLEPFFAECCTFKPELWVKTAQLRKAYSDWCERNGERPVNARTFDKAMEANGCSAANFAPKGRHWRGVGIASDSQYATT